jgi:DNA-binding transcriptional ArsR family regulator
MAFTTKPPAPSEEQLDRLFQALSDGTRRDILRRCFTQEPSVSHLATSYPISLTAIQKHVRVLEDAGLITRTRKGREQLVSTRHDGIEQARQALDKLERDWRGRTDRMSALLDEMSASIQPAEANKGESHGSHKR